jgi:hypothetical protein
VVCVRGAAHKLLPRVACAGRRRPANTTPPKTTHNTHNTHKQTNKQTPPRHPSSLQSKVANYVSRGIVSLQGVDRQGRSLMVVHVAANLTKERDLAELKLFTCYTIDAMVSAFS